MARTKAPEVESLSDQLDINALIRGLMGDLRDLRAGTITVPQAKARAELARQILRGVHYVVQANKFLEAQVKALPQREPQA